MAIEEATRIVVTTAVQVMAGDRASVCTGMCAAKTLGTVRITTSEAGMINKPKLKRVSGALINNKTVLGAISANSHISAARQDLRARPQYNARQTTNCQNSTALNHQVPPVSQSGIQ